MRFCPQCGAPLMAGAKFCIECGERLAEADRPAVASTAHSKPDAAAASKRSGFQLTGAFTAVFFGIVIAGLAAAAYLLNRPLPRPGAPSPAGQSAQGGSSQNASGQLPAGHPKIELPAEARTFIDKIEREAKAKPGDVAAWVRLGAVSMRAALFDESYYQKAADAFSRALKLDPENPDALRGIGDIDYDRRKYDEAIAAYEHYLKNKPDDAEVMVDLGTMYLDTGNGDQAVAQYRKAIALKPDFYQAYYNLGAAYAGQNDPGAAAAALAKAIALAPDDHKRKEASELFTRLTGRPPVAAPKTAPGAAASPGSPAKGATFQSALEQMMRNLPVAGGKVSAVRWSGKYAAQVLMDNFPMDSMPPLAKDRFLSGLKARIDSVKAAHNVTRQVKVDIVDARSGRVMQTVTE